MLVLVLSDLQKCQQTTSSKALSGTLMLSSNLNSTQHEMPMTLSLWKVLVVITNTSILMLNYWYNYLSLVMHQIPCTPMSFLKSTWRGWKKLMRLEVDMVLWGQYIASTRYMKLVLQQLTVSHCLCLWRYQYEWKLEEAQKNILRTHTTAVSARMLYKLGQQVYYI